MIDETTPAFDFDAAIVGGGPAGLSAAVILGRSRRRVVLLDHGKPRNYAARTVHCYLGLDGITPAELRAKGRDKVKHYGVMLFDEEVTKVRCLGGGEPAGRGFEICTAKRVFSTETLLIATGVVDELPNIPNLRDFYGRSVHHCPYCDGWEHRDQRVAVFGNGDAAAELGLSLRTWSANVTACSNGRALSGGQRDQLSRNGVTWREEAVIGLAGSDGILTEILFKSGPPLQCDALFFSADQSQHSRLAVSLGCEVDEHHLLKASKKQAAGIDGLFLAGDIDGEVQFAIVAAAEGAIAATAMNQYLQKRQQK